MTSEAKNSAGLMDKQFGQKKSLTYSEYLQLNKVLCSQHLMSREKNKIPAHDEHLFIITHQTYELWFKQILHELDSIRSNFLNKQGISESKTIQAIRGLNRIILILRLLVDQITILETMTPLDFNEFRNLLSPASGFQSLQFRLIENKLGLKQESRSKFHQNYSDVFGRDEVAMDQIVTSEDEPTLLGLIQRWLEKTPGLESNGFTFWGSYINTVNCMFETQIKAAMKLNCESERTILLTDIERRKKVFETIFDINIHNALIKKGERQLSHKALQAAIMVTFYRDEPQFTQRHQVISLLVDIDSLLYKWRFNHVLMVQRMIGSHSVGTGGSSGYHYLRSTLSDRYKIFNDFCNISTYLLPSNLIPPLNNSVKNNIANSRETSTCLNSEEIHEETSEMNGYS